MRLAKAWREPWPLSTHLSLLALCTTLPLLAYAGLLLNHFNRQNRELYDQRLVQTVSSVAADIDRQLQAMTVTLRTLATSQLLEEGRFDEFRTDARRAIGDQYILLLKDPNGRILVDTRSNEPAGQPHRPATDAKDRKLTAGEAKVSGLAFATPGGAAVIELSLPLADARAPRYSLVIAFPPDVVRDILVGQKLPVEWVTGVSDANAKVIARSQMHARFLGTPLPKDLIGYGRETVVFPAVNLEGVPVFRTVTPLKSADWMVAATVPRTVVTGTARAGIAQLVTIGAVLVGLSLALATLLARRIGAHIATLTKPEELETASKGVLPLKSGPVREINTVAGILAREAERRTEHEARIEEQRGFLNLVLMAVPSVVYIYNLSERRTKFASGAVSAVLGHPISEAQIGPDPLAELVNPDDLPAIAAHHKALETLPPDTTRSIEFRMRHKSGAWHWLMSIDRPWRRDASGRLLEIIGIAVDITDRKATEADLAQHASVTQAAHDALIATDRQGVILTWNPGAERLFGYPASDVIGKHVSILGAPAAHSEQAAMLATTLSGKTVGPLDAERRRNDGSMVAVSLSMSPVIAADGSVIGVVKAAQDVSERKRLERRQALLARELVHRGKNQLAVISSIARATLRSTPDPKAFTEALFGRLQSLAAAQDSLVGKQWECAEISDVARTQLMPHADDDPSRIELDGPHVMLPSEYAVPVGLALHELATNAAKYGALSVQKGRISLSWSTTRTETGTEVLELCWREIDGPPVSAPARRGFGSTLIEQCVPGARVERTFDAAGLVCTMHVPLVVKQIPGATPGDTSGLFAAHS